ncbi:MAG: hypothetical protein R6V04_15055 [bacterium]
MNTILIFVKKITVFDFTTFWLDYIAILVSLFMLVVIIRSAYKNLTKLDREEKSLWDD